jgi:hypothetical protein
MLDALSIFRAFTLSSVNDMFLGNLAPWALFFVEVSVNKSDLLRSPQMLDADCKMCVAGGESVPTQSRCMEARSIDDDDDEDDDEPQRPVGRPPMRSMLLRNMGGRS